MGYATNSFMAPSMVLPHGEDVPYTLSVEHAVRYAIGHPMEYLMDLAMAPTPRYVIS